jgi:hypothetical protein
VRDGRVRVGESDRWGGVRSAAMRARPRGRDHDRTSRGVRRPRRRRANSLCNPLHALAAGANE